MKQISIIGATFYGNRGAEAMLSTAIGTLREHYPDLRCNVFTYYPEHDRQLVEDANIEIYSSAPSYLVSVLFPCALVYWLLGLLHLKFLQRMLPASIRALGNSQVLICLAGVSFVQGRTKFLPFNIMTIWPAMLTGTPVIKYAQAMGPFSSLINRLAAKVFLRRCRKVFTRGEKTQQHLDEVFHGEVFFERADDLAFLFRKEYCLSKPASYLVEERLAQSTMDGKKNPVIGICPSIVVAKQAKVAGWDYRTAMVELISAITAKNQRVLLFPNATRGEDMDKLHNNDLPLLDDIYRQLPAQTQELTTLFSGSLNVAQIHTIIKHCDIVAVSRFHAMVGALASAVPVVVIGWSHKYLEVMERFGQGDMVLDYQQSEMEPVLQLIDTLLKEKSARTQTIAAALPGVQVVSEKQVGFVLNILGKA